MAGTIDTGPENVTAASLGSAGEAALLKEEIARYRRIFDSATMIVGHELIKPLTSISGYIELLEGRFEKICSDDEKRYFAKVREAIGRLQELIDAFLMLLRFDSEGEQAEVTESINLRELVENLRPREGPGRVRLRNAIDPDMPPVVSLKRQLEVVLDNLISNALKHSGDNVPVTVSAEVMKDRRAGGAEEVLIVRVEDEGVGIPEHELEEIFHPFFKGGSENRGGGLGLGLALVKNIIDLMGGEVSVDSKPGEGTKATFSVPLRERAQADSGENERI